MNAGMVYGNAFGDVAHLAKGRGDDPPKEGSRSRADSDFVALRMPKLSEFGR